MKYRLMLTGVIISSMIASTSLFANANYVFAEETKILGTGQCGENVYWTLYSDGTLDLEGTGATYDYTLKYSLVSGENHPNPNKEFTSEFGYPTWFDLVSDLDNFFIEKINVGEGITRLGDLIFSDDYMYYVYNINLPDSLEEIGYFSFAISTYNENGNALNSFPKNLKVIEDGGFYAFDFQDKIVLPESVEKIGSFAFNTTAKEYVIPQNVKEISPLAFGFIENENYVDNDPIYDPFVEDNLEPIWKFVEVAIYRKDVDSVIDVFKADTDVTVYGYTDTAAETYANENNFEFVKLDPEILGTGQCGENVYWTLYSDGTLDLEGTGATYDYTLDHSVITEPEGWKHYEVSSEYGYPTWFDLDLDFWDFAITTINVGEGITRLGDLIFVTNLIYYAEEINLPDSLEEIGFFALSIDTNSYYEPNVINKFPENLRVIEDGAFYSMYFDDKIVLPESVEKIGNFAFNTSAKEYVIPQNVKEISPLAFGFTGNEDYVDNYPIYDEVNEEYLEQFFKFRWAAMYQKDISHVTDVFKADTGVTVYHMLTGDMQNQNEEICIFNRMCIMASIEILKNRMQKTLSPDEELLNAADQIMKYMHTREVFDKMSFKE